MRQAFAHDAILMMEPDADVREPGAAITVALCGHWDHPPPCPLAPHRVHADRTGDEVHVRILFAVEPDAEHEVRDRIEHALSGQVQLPEGLVARWRLRGSQPGTVAPTETAAADYLIRH